MEDPLLGTAVLGLHNKDEWVVHTVQLCNNPLFSFFFNSSQSEKPLRVQIAKVHLPTGFSWNELYEKKIKDLAVIELMTDVQFSPKVKIIKKCKCPQVLPICLPPSGGFEVSGFRGLQVSVSHNTYIHSCLFRRAWLGQGQQ